MKHFATILVATALVAIATAAPGSSAGETPRCTDCAIVPGHVVVLALKRKLANLEQQNRKQAATIEAFAATSRRVVKELSGERAAKAGLCASNAALVAAPGSVQTLLDTYCGSGIHAVASTTEGPAPAVADPSAETPDTAAPDEPARTSPPGPPAAAPRVPVPEPPAATPRSVVPQPPG